MRFFGTSLAAAGLTVLFATSAAPSARADEAVVHVGNANDPRFAPPPNEADNPIVPDDDPRAFPRGELRRSPFRLQLAPTMITSGKGLGGGVQAAADIG